MGEESGDRKRQEGREGKRKHNFKRAWKRMREISEIWGK